MTIDDDLQAALDQFFERTDVALDEYDQGYTDADATLRVLRDHVEDLREAAPE